MPITWNRLARLAPLFAVMVAAGVEAAELNLKTPRDNLTALRRIQCTLKDGETQTWYWSGSVYSRVPGEPDRKVFAVEGMNIRQCGPSGDAKDGGFRIVTREIMLYQDPVTRQVLRTWDNPWTGKQVKVIHVANDPVNNRPGPTDREGRPFALPLVVNGDQWWYLSTVPLFYSNPLGGEYQDYVGGKYHATEMFHFFGDVKDLTNARLDSVPVSVAWVRLSDWLPWMMMGDRPGMLYFTAGGRKLARFDELSETLKAEIKASYPAWAGPPPLDDARPNETSWTYFKKQMPAPQ